MDLDSYRLNLTNVAFKLVNSDLQLSMAITRSAEFYEQMGDIAVVTCSVYARLYNPADKSAGALSVSTKQFFAAHDQKALEAIYVTGEREGFRLCFPCAEFRSIDPAERERLLQFLGELRGVELHYTADLFGFRKGDGSDRRQIIKQPFPVFTRQMAPEVSQ